MAMLDDVRAGPRTPAGVRRVVGRHDRPQHREAVNAAREAIARGRELVGCDPEEEDDGGPEPLDGLDELERALGAIIDRAVDELDAPRAPRARITALTKLVLDLEAERGHVRERRVVERLEALAAVQASLDRLRPIHDMPTLLARAPEALCAACGLERGVLSQVDGSTWTIEGAYFDGNDEWAAEFVRLGRDEYSAQLNHLLLETEMVRRRGPSLVHGAQQHPLAHRPLVEHADVQSYVSAPIMPAGQVIGFVHGDYYYSGHPVDTLDRDTLWAFAQGFGQIIERASLFGRLRAQREEVQRLLASADAVMQDLAGSEVQFHEGTSGHVEVTRTAAAMFAAPDSRIERLLTRRQTEILGLMAAGETNLEIANRLVIAPGTVKTHVKHILRKLRAANRAEAVSKYFRMTIGTGHQLEPDDD